MTFTATVSSPATPTGTVTFYAETINSSESIGAGTLSLVSGQYEATISTHGLAVTGSPYSITAVYGGDSNDEGSDSNADSLAVTPAPLVVAANNASKVYGAALPALSVSYSGFVNGDTSSSLTTQPTVTTTATSKSAVGSYTITAGGAVDANYTISYVTGTLSVTPAALVITANNATKVYGAALPSLSVSYSGFVNGDTSSSLTTQPTVTTTATSKSAVGSYTITAGGAVDANYTISYVTGTLSVTPAALVITANNATKVYGAALPSLSVSYSGFVNGDTSSSLTTQPTVSTTATSKSAVGSYTITASGAVDANYTISYVSGTLSVTPAALVITANNATKVYGAALPSLSVSYSGFVNGDTSSSLTTQPTVSTTATSKSAVGSYTITASGAVDANYTISYVSGTLSVTPAPLTITAKNQSKVYGQVNPTLTVSYSGFVNGDTSSSLTTQPTVTTTATTTSPVGTYQITASGAVDANYTISYVAGTLTINQDASTTSVNASTTSGSFGMSITLTATVTANSPGSGTPTGSVQFLDTTTDDNLGTVTLSGGVASLATSSLPPGSQTIEASYSGNSNFLSSSATTGTITISPSIIVLASSASGSLTISGNASIKVSGVVYVDSSSSSAISASGNASVTASAIDVHGGVQKSGNATFSPTPTTGAAVLSDPLAALPAPSTSGLTNYGSENLSGNSSATIKPGIYSSISVSGNASLTLSAGLYLIEGGGFSTSGNASVSGSGVLIYNAGSNYPNSGGSFGAISLSGNGSTSLSPASTGSYAGIMLIQPAANTQTLSFSGNSMAGVTGAIYAPAAQLSESGNAQLSVTLDVDTLTLSGNASAQFVALAGPATTVGATEPEALPASSSRAAAASLQAPAGSTLPTAGQPIWACIGPIPQAISPQNQLAWAPADWAHRSDVTATIDRAQVATDVAAYESGPLVDSVLDDLVSESMPPRGLDAASTAIAPRRSLDCADRRAEPSGRGQIRPSTIHSGTRRAADAVGSTAPVGPKSGAPRECRAGCWVLRLWRRP